MANSRAAAMAFEWPDPPLDPSGFPVHRLTIGWWNSDRPPRCPEVRAMREELPTNLESWRSIFGSYLPCHTRAGFWCYNGKWEPLISLIILIWNTLCHHVRSLRTVSVLAS